MNPLSKTRNEINVSIDWFVAIPMYNKITPKMVNTTIVNCVGTRERSTMVKYQVEVRIRLLRLTESGNDITEQLWGTQRKAMIRPRSNKQLSASNRSEKS